jgi:hypothetical protein
MISNACCAFVATSIIWHGFCGVLHKNPEKGFAAELLSQTNDDQTAVLRQSPGLFKQNNKNQSDVIMKGKKSKLSLAALALLAICGRIPVALATPIIVDELNYQGAVFTLGGEWIDRIYRMTYTAQFGASESSGDRSLLTAIDWKWEGGKIHSVLLREAPGGTDAWRAQISHQIGGDAFGCLEDGDSNAVCTEFVGPGAGLFTDQAETVSWVFDISFKHLTQQNGWLKQGPRRAYVNETGRLATPTMAADVPAEVAAVPVPGLPALLLIGLAGLSLCRAGGSKVART